MSAAFPREAGHKLPRFESREGRLNLFSADGHEAADMDMARFIMALRAKGLRETVLLSAVEHAPRRSFFDEALWPYLYADVALPLPCGAEATSAHSIAHMLNAAGLKQGMRVLEIGTGSGYQAALLALLAGSVISIERFRSLAIRARRSLASLAMGTAVEVRLGDGLNLGDWPDGTFDRIIVNGTIEACPPAWFERLAQGGAIIVSLVTEEGPVLTRIERAGEDMRHTTIGSSRLPRLKAGRARIL